MEKSLLRIANTLVLYSYHVTGNGLLNGRMGIILYLFRYSSYAGNEYYSDFAGDLLDKVLRTSANMPSDFENGLTGVGWAVNRLLKEGLVDGNPNEVLQSVDRKVFNWIACNPGISLFGQAVYLLERWQDNLNVPYFEEQAIHILHICEGGIRKSGGKISLYHINSVLHFLIGINRMRKCMEKANVVCKLLPDILRRILKQKWYTPADCLIFEQLKQEAEKYHPELWYEIQSICFPQTNGPIKNMEQYIRIAWLQELYFGKVIIPLPTTEEIGTFIDRKQQKITLDGFLLQNGLAGLGCMLLPTNQQTTLNHITNL